MTSKEKQRSPNPNNASSTNQEQLSTISVIREVRREEEAWKVHPGFMFFFMLAEQTWIHSPTQSNASGAAVDVVSLRLTPLNADLRLKSNKLTSEKDQTFMR